MEIYARQGDLVIEKVANISGELETMKRITFAGDSSGHPHTAVGKFKARKDGLRTFVRVEGKPLDITHGKSDGHKTVSLEPGDYEIRPLRERGAGLDRAVED